MQSELLISFFLFQSARLRAAGFGKDFKENPNLRDNWTDAEGYYRKSCRFPTIAKRRMLNGKDRHVEVLKHSNVDVLLCLH